MIHHNEFSQIKRIFHLAFRENPLGGCLNCTVLLKEVDLSTHAQRRHRERYAKNEPAEGNKTKTRL